MKSGPESELLDHYLARARAAGRGLGISEVAMREFAESRAPDTDRRRDEEAAQLIGATARDGIVIALDERGRDHDSAAFSRLIGDRLGDGTPEIAFLIGGPDGHGEEVRQKAAATISFGRATWPHRLVRIMLAEQVYRAITILAGHPYHRE